MHCDTSDGGMYDSKSRKRVSLRHTVRLSKYSCIALSTGCLRFFLSSTAVEGLPFVQHDLLPEDSVQHHLVDPGELFVEYQGSLCLAQRL